MPKATEKRVEDTMVKVLALYRKKKTVMRSTEQTFGLFCTFILYSAIIARENEDNRFIGGNSWITLN